MTRDRSFPRSLALVAAAGVIAAAGLVLVIAVLGSEPTAVARAREHAERARGETSAVDAAEALGEATQHLVDATAACRDDAARGVRCDAVGAAAGYTQVLTARVLGCTTPERHDAISALLRHYDEVEDLADDAERPPALPPLPTCRHG